MQLEELKNSFAGAIKPSVLSAWELEEFSELLLDYPGETQRMLLNQVSVIWPVSNSLCRNFLHGAKKATACLSPLQIGEWVKTILGRYEEHGLRAAQEVIEGIEANFLCLLAGETGITLQEVAGRIQHYLRGISGHELEVCAAPTIYTDTARIFLPAKLNIMPSRQENFLLYKVTATYQWGYITCGTFNVSLDNVSNSLQLSLPGTLKRSFHPDDGLPCFFSQFTQQLPPLTLYHLLETVRVTQLLWHEFPGLMRDCRPLFARLLAQLPRAAGSPFASLIETIQHAVLCYEPGNDARPTANRTPAYENPEILFTSLRSSLDSLRLTYELCKKFPTHTATSPDSLIFQGILNYREAFSARMKKRAEHREKFITALAVILATQQDGKSVPQEKNEVGQGLTAFPAAEAGAIIVPLPAEKHHEGEPPEHGSPKTPDYLTVDDEHLPPALKNLRSQIIADLGRVPDHYVASARQRSGTGRSAGRGPEGGGEAELAGKDLYDEWDYRRKGFRKNWCRLLLKEVAPVGGTYISNVLTAHRGQLTKLRRQFEMLRAQEHFVRRQDDGPDIDLDAVTDFLADRQAGIAATDGLFIRLKRDRRSIAAVFLVDMSSSTEGWVSNTIKESLILLCEALEALGDPYGIYGFSGMRRLRSELFHIKHLDEPYTETVKGRIAAISPMEYTRMGPPIRHLTRVLEKTEAKIRLLITLSDGKPEDYDDYKGDYAVEDTRHALIEAKTKGIHPFCITIDRQAHEYMAHMYGEVNYIFIDNVKKLPIRIPEIYRTLTT